MCYDQMRSDVIDERDHGQARLLLFQVEVRGALEQSESHIRSLGWSGYERLMTTSYERASAKVSDSAPISYDGDVWTTFKMIRPAREQGYLPSSYQWELALGRR